jgi:hypothetical protein
MVNIAKKLNISKNYVYVIRKELGLPHRYNTVDVNDVIRLHNENFTVPEIASELKISKCYVYAIQRQLGLSSHFKARKDSDAESDS